MTIPIGVTNIEHGTFSNCVGLTDVGIPESVKSISTFAFFNCSNLANMTIPEGVTIIEENAFCGCSKLSDIIIPDSVTQISAAFSRCSKLTIHAPADSYAERYAEENGIPFVALTI